MSPSCPPPWLIFRCSPLHPHSGSLLARRLLRFMCAQPSVWLHRLISTAADVVADGFARDDVVIRCGDGSDSCGEDALAQVAHAPLAVRRVPPALEQGRSDAGVGGRVESVDAHEHAVSAGAVTRVGAAGWRQVYGRGVELVLVDEVEGQPAALCVFLFAVADAGAGAVLVRGVVDTAPATGVDEAVGACAGVVREGGVLCVVVVVGAGLVPWRMGLWLRVVGCVFGCWTYRVCAKNW